MHIRSLSPSEVEELRLHYLAQSKKSDAELAFDNFGRSVFTAFAIPATFAALTFLAFAGVCAATKKV